MWGKERLKVKEGNQSQENHPGNQNAKSYHGTQSDMF
jgi:hypothetical protein